MTTLIAGLFLLKIEDNMENKTLIENYHSVLTEIPEVPSLKPMKIDKKIEKLLNTYKSQIAIITDVPPLSDKFIALNLTAEPGRLELVELDNRDRERKTVQGIGKILNKIYKGIDVVSDPIVQKLIIELQQLSTKAPAKSPKDALAKKGYTMMITNNIAKWYRMCNKKSGISSCVSGSEEKLMTGFDNDPNIKLAVLKDIKTDEVKGRALLWSNVEDKETHVFNTYIDRTYPSDDSQIKNIYIEWAKSNKYWYRQYQGYDEYVQISGKKMKLRFRFSQSPDKMKYVPYMDTFKNLYKSTKFENLIGTNYKTKNRNWWGEGVSGTRIT